MSYVIYPSIERKRQRYKRNLILGVSIFIFIIVTCISIFAADYGTLKATVVRVHDGDTIIVNINKVPGIFGDEIGVRVNGVDTPEMNGKCAYEKDLAIKARDLTASLVKPGQVVNLQHVDRDKYFRILATVMVGKKDLAKILIDAGLAHEYHGLTKSPWCLDTQFPVLDPNVITFDPAKE